MSNVSADINVELRFAGDFEIEVNAEVDRDKDVRSISLFYTNPMTKRWRRISDRNPRVDAYILKHFDDQINEAICSATIDTDDTEYDLSKDSY
tara:strand:+ start:2383 stop:2661 length:279 start_codon:yes stop_codon:yes gene_type:complete